MFTVRPDRDLVRTQGNIQYIICTNIAMIVKIKGMGKITTLCKQFNPHLVRICGRARTDISHRNVLRARPLLHFDLESRKSEFPPVKTDDEKKSLAFCSNCIAPIELCSPNTRYCFNTFLDKCSRIDLEECEKSVSVHGQVCQNDKRHRGHTLV